VIALLGGTPSERTALEELIDAHGGIVAHSVAHKRVTHAALVSGSRSDHAAALKSASAAVRVVDAQFVRDAAAGKDVTKTTTTTTTSAPPAPTTTVKSSLKRPEPPSGGAAIASGHQAKKSRAPRCIVDAASGMALEYHVVDDGGSGGAWDAILNQTNVAKNNNKFYKLQLLKANARPEWRCWFRWGRVGVTGQSSNEPFTSLEAAKACFKKKFREKTKNDWDTRLESFTKHANKYDMIEIEYTDHWDDDDDDEGGRSAARAATSVVSSKKVSAPPTPTPSATPTPVPVPTPTPTPPPVAVKSALHAHDLPDVVARFIAMICDVKAMSDYMLEMDIDTKKMPLGKLSKKQIHKGYEILKRVEAELKGGNSKAVFLDCSNQFYTLIPHSFGMKRPPVLDNVVALEAKLAMLSSLAEMEVAIKLLALGDKFEHPIAANYKSLKCEMTPVARDDALFGLLARYMARTHASTHDWYTLELVDLLEVDRAGERDAFRKHAHLRRQLLWHGSRTTNFAGIIGQGLRIAPPEAPVTGYMFGKGLYTTDTASKSANYCHCTKSQPFGVMALCEVALGDMLPLRRAEFVTTLPAGKHSTFGVGEMTPDPAEFAMLPDGTEVPCGRLIPSGVVRGDGPDDTDLLYNEYIVYDVTQIRMRYLLKVKFNFK
jgi:predicted DNA-binding WGR domain protein